MLYCVGEYEINVLWNEMKLIPCPVVGHAQPSTGSTTNLSKAVTSPPVPTRDKIILTGHGLTEARVNRHAEFVIDATDAVPGNMIIIFFGQARAKSKKS